MKEYQNQTADATTGGAIGYHGPNPFLVEETSADSLSVLLGRLEHVREDLQVAFHRTQFLADRLSGPVPQSNTANSGSSPVPDGILPSLHLEAAGLEHWLEGLRGELGRIEKALG